MLVWWMVKHHQSWSKAHQVHSWNTKGSKDYSVQWLESVLNWISKGCNSQVLVIKYPRCYDCRRIVSIGEQISMQVFRLSEQGSWCLHPSWIMCCASRCLFPIILRLHGDMIFKGEMSSGEIKFIGHLTLQNETTGRSWNLGRQTPSGRVQCCGMMRSSGTQLCDGGICCVQLQGCPRRPFLKW
jgi:hypothetical protein